MPYKIENGQIVLKDGLPVFVRDDGNETTVDYSKMLAEIGSVTSESIARKKELREYKDRLKTFEEKFGNLDADEAKKALELMRNIDQKELIKAGEKDAAIRQAIESKEKEYIPKLKSFEQKLSELSSELQRKDSIISRQMIEGQLAINSYLNKATRTTPDVRASILGKHFKIEDVNGELRPVAYKSDGEKLYSPINPGQLCTFDEAVEILWNSYPNKDVYAVNLNSGSGSTGNPGGSGNAGVQYFTKEEWTRTISSAKSEDQKKLITALTTGKIKITSK